MSTDNTDSTSHTDHAGNNAPIGIFDSGVGGLTVARSIVDQLTGESIV